MAEDKNAVGKIAHIDTGKSNMARAISSVLAMGVAPSLKDPTLVTEDQGGRPDVDPINEGEGRPDEGMRDIKAGTETIIERFGGLIDGTQSI